MNDENWYERSACLGIYQYLHRAHLAGVVREWLVLAWPDRACAESKQKCAFLNLEEMVTFIQGYVTMPVKG